MPTPPGKLLTAWGLRPRKQLGQNFLKSPGIAEAIVEKAKLAKTDAVVEIGAGLGAMTIPAARRVKSVIAVETDERLTALLQTELTAAGLDNVTVRRGDILNTGIESLCSSPPPLREQPVLIGNLPYGISSRVVVWTVDHRDVFRRAVFMFQRELAGRLCAAPGGREYGRLSVLLAYCAEVTPLMHIPKEAFYPRPRVDSTVVEIRFHPAPPLPAKDETLLRRVIRAGFGNRRKTLKNALSAGEFGFPPQAAERLLHGAGIDPGRRAESLSVEEFVKLADGISDRQSTDE
jgi:16S rRNA (adenine1518-N6/adenine1519-N6)-dimethyltransferase